MVELNPSADYDVLPLHNLDNWGQLYSRFQNQEYYTKGWLTRPSFTINGTGLELGAHSYIVDDALLKYKDDDSDLIIPINSISPGQYGVVILFYSHSTPFVAPVYSVITKTPTQLIAFDLAAYQASNPTHLVVCVAQKKLDGTFHSAAIQNHVFTWSAFAPDRDYAEMDIIAKFGPDGVFDGSFESASLPGNKEIGLTIGEGISNLEFFHSNLTKVFITSDSSSTTYTAIGVALNSKAVIYYDTGIVTPTSLSGYDAPNNVKDMMYIDPMVTVTDPANILTTNVYDARRLIVDKQVSRESIILLNQKVDPTNVVPCGVYYTGTRWTQADFNNLPIAVMVSKNVVGIEAWGDIVFKGERAVPDIGFTGSVYMDSDGTVQASSTRIRLGFAPASDKIIVDIDIEYSPAVLESQSIGSSVLGEPVYWTGSQWDKASYDNLPTGIIHRELPSGGVTLAGFVSGLSGLTPGWVYMDSSGNYTPVVTDVKIGYALSATQLLVDIDFSSRVGVDSYDIDSMYEDFQITEIGLRRINANNLWGHQFIRNSWIATGPLNTARSALAGAGVQNAALSFGGYSGGTSAITEKFNGSSWITSGGMDLNTARQSLAGAGIQAAALSFGGYVTLVNTEKFNGSSWANTGNLGTGRWALGGAGIQNAALSFGGNTTAGVTPSAVTEKFNGSTWSASGSLNTARWQLGGTGLYNATLSFGGRAAGSELTTTEKFNGFIWIATSNLNFASYGLAGAGIQNAALSFGGYSGGTSAITEKFNGSSWITSGGMDLNTARIFPGGTGTKNSALSFGGFFPSYWAVTEKFIGEPPLEFYGIYKSLNYFVDILFDGNYASILESPVDIAIGVKLKDNSGLSEEEIDHIIELNRLDFGDGKWTATGSLNTARGFLGGCGVQNAALAFGGYNAGDLSSAEKFNGTSWSATGSMNNARIGIGSAGAQNTALYFTGEGSGTQQPETEKFNGTSWSVTGNVNTSRRYPGGSGIQNAALSFGGNVAGGLTVTEKFNGTSWTVTGNLNSATWLMGSAGSQNAALRIGGIGANTETEKFNGIVWSFSARLNKPNNNGAGAGVLNSALVFGGDTIGPENSVEKFNGFLWIEAQININGHMDPGGAGIRDSALVFGHSSGPTAITEKFNTELVIPFTGSVGEVLIG